jgi:tRNA modification GTPase
MMPADVDHTFVARLTPPGTGAIATLALRGPLAWQTVRRLFHFPGRPGTSLPDVPPSGQFWLGRLADPSGGGLADEVIVAARLTNPVPWVEVHCHGGTEVVRLLLEILQSQGLEPCSWQELEQRTTSDPRRAQAAVALAEARTIRTAAILLDQYQGAFTRGLAEIRAALESARTADALHQLEQLARLGPVGRHLVHPWKVVIAGAPNVGKSTLLNALAGYQRAIVSPTPGTTRDLVTTLIAIDGWPVELADTAGQRTQPGDLERQGIDRARQAAGSADLCLWILDQTDAPLLPPANLSSVRFVVNKTDLPPDPNFQAPPDSVPISARTGAGLDRLTQMVIECLIPHPPPPGAPVPFTPELCDRIDQAHHLCTVGRIRQALAQLW